MHAVPDLLRRVYGVDMRSCPNCSTGRLEPIATILARDAIDRILARMGLHAPPSACAAMSPARPSAADQLHWDGADRVAFELKTPWRDGTTHLAMTPLDFMERLAALVLRPRLIRKTMIFHGRGRDGDCSPPPAQIPPSGFPAAGSSLG